MSIAENCLRVAQYLLKSCLGVTQVLFESCSWAAREFFEQFGCLISWEYIEPCFTRRNYFHLYFKKQVCLSCNNPFDSVVYTQEVPEMRIHSIKLLYLWLHCWLVYYYKKRVLIIQGRLKIWTEHSHWFLLTPKPLEILWQNFQHFYNLEKYEFWPNLKDVAQKLDLPRPLEVFYIFGGKSKFWAPMTLIFSAKRIFIEVNNWWKFGVDISIHFWEIQN